ncbi:helix-turn-helix domain-containing protein [Streptomyces syringium]|uniref:helix-turn-helix domain-containing protein n=1 Tax=Streptomyces syringium TaxID=76729 RepID=UPI0036E66AC3
MSRHQKSAGPVPTIALRVKELRGRRGWTAAQLGEALGKHGVRWDRFAVANLENGKRQNVTVQELIALALALDVAPVNLLVPLDDRPYQLTPTRAEGADTVRAWVRGEEPLPGTDERTFMGEVSTKDLQEQRRYLSFFDLEKIAKERQAAAAQSFESHIPMEPLDEEGRPDQ